MLFLESIEDTFIVYESPLVFLVKNYIVQRITQLHYIIPCF